MRTASSSIRTVDHLGQRFNVQSAAADDVEEERAQLLGLERCGDFENIVNFQAAPQVLGLLDLPIVKRQPFSVPTLAPVMISGVQSSACRGMPDTDLVASLGTAPRKHQRALSGMFHRKKALLFVVLFIIAFFCFKLP